MQPRKLRVIWGTSPVSCAKNLVAFIWIVFAYKFARAELARGGMKDTEIKLIWDGTSPSIDDECDPSHPMNIYHIYFKKSLVNLLEDVCYYMYNLAEQGTTMMQNKQMFREILHMQNTTTANTYLNNIGDEDLEMFVDEVANYWDKWGSVTCENADSFHTSIDFLSFGTTDTRMISDLVLHMGDYIKLVERNMPVSTDELEDGLWGLDRIDQETLPLDNDLVRPHGATGENVHIYIVDSGILNSHTEFEGRIGMSYDVVDEDNDASDCSSGGHGTQVAGIAAGATMGVAPQATLHAVRVFDCNGGGTTGTVIAGIDWIAANAQKPAVVSLSLGSSNSVALNKAVENLFNMGIPVVAAAGNQNVDACTVSPASSEFAYTVAATALPSVGYLDARAEYSNFGECCNIFAPGSSILTAHVECDTCTVTVFGTSMATPLVSGSVALLLQLNPTFTPQQVYDTLTELGAKNRVADPVGTPNIILSVENFPLECVSVAGVPDIDCVASDWTTWSACSQACGPGTQTRSRTVVSPKSGCGSCEAARNPTETRECLVQACQQSQPSDLVENVETYRYKTIHFAPTGTTAYTLDCSADIPEGLPVSTTSATRVAIADDGTYLVQLTGAKQIRFFGKSYSQMFINSNGHVTFGGSGDPAWESSLARHFSQPRISLLMTDLNPPGGGAVSYQEFDDKMVVSFEAVPYYGNVFSATMQMEIFFADGRVVLSYGWITATNQPLVIGLSAGGSVPSDFSNLLLIGTTCGKSLSPTALPATASPTTNAPTTRSPSQSPTTHTPTVLADTAAPTLLPSEPPPSPPVSTTSPTTSSPTWSPTTQDLPEYMATPTQIFTSPSTGFNNGFDLLNKEITMILEARGDGEQGSVQYRVVCEQFINTLETSDSWTVLDMANTPSVKYTLEEVVTVGSFQYRKLFVHKNGFVGFRRDRSEEVSSARHFSQVRVAVANMELDTSPEKGGVVRVAEGDDFALVSWEHVPAVGGGTYSFQVKIFRSGKIVMRWVEYTPTELPTIVGISFGKYPLSFRSLDLTALLAASNEEGFECGELQQADVQLTVSAEDSCPSQMFVGTETQLRRTLMQSSKTNLQPRTGTNNFDLANKAVTFAPMGQMGASYVAHCTQPIQELMTSPDQGIQLNLVDDDSQLVELSDGATFPYFGYLFSSVYVGSNGYITPDRADTEYDPTAHTHYKYPRISGLFTDLNPSLAGRVSAQQLADRLVVSYVEIPHRHSATVLFTFQIELFFDGRIRVGYADIPNSIAVDMIVGLSAGAMYSHVPPDEFHQPTLSAQPSSCPTGYVSPYVEGNVPQALPSVEFDTLWVRNAMVVDDELLLATNPAVCPLNVSLNVVYKSESDSPSNQNDQNFSASLENDTDAEDSGSAACFPSACPNSVALAMLMVLFMWE